MLFQSGAMSRRAALRSFAGIALGQWLLPRSFAMAAEGGGSSSSVAPAAPSAPASPAAPSAPSAPRRFPVGKPGDFDFLAGEWRIHHRQLKNKATNEWITFEGEATCWTILKGVGSVEELRIPARGFSGMGLRLLDVDQQLWSDFWVNAKSGVLTTPGMPGGFTNGVGTFLVDDVEDGRPIVARGVWDEITPKSCRWHQGVSYDGGATWEENWWMDWRRA